MGRKKGKNVPTKSAVHMSFALAQFEDIMIHSWARDSPGDRAKKQKTDSDDQRMQVRDSHFIVISTVVRFQFCGY